MTKLALIAAIANNNAIGFENKLVYWLPNDLRRFKELTTGHTIIMGSNTFRSLPKGALPNRRNIVLSRKETSFPGTETFSSLEEALSNCSSEEVIYIIGGETLYRVAMPHCRHFMFDRNQRHSRKCRRILSRIQPLGMGNH